MRIDGDRLHREDLIWTDQCYLRVFVLRNLSLSNDDRKIVDHHQRQKPKIQDKLCCTNLRNYVFDLLVHDLI